MKSAAAIGLPGLALAGILVLLAAPVDAFDCNHNGVDDAIDIASGVSADCNGNQVPDDCDIVSHTSTDCNMDWVPDDCQYRDCNSNGIPDLCETLEWKSIDCNHNYIPDVCEVNLPGSDCNLDGLIDSCQIANGTVPDCNRNGIPDECDLRGGQSRDYNQNGIPDECEDCNQNGLADECDIAAGMSDIDHDGHLDSCGAVFSFGFDVVPERLVGEPGAEVTFDVFVTLTTSNNFSADGPMGWTFTAWGINCQVTGVSVKGVVVQTIYDEEDASGNIIAHHDPYPMDLGGAFASIARRRGCIDGRTGGSCAVVLRGQERMVLQPNGTQRIARLMAKATIPAGGGCAPLRSLFGTWPEDANCDGHVIQNLITFGVGSAQPTLRAKDLLACPMTFRRGDVNSDGAADISDVISGINYLYLGGDTPLCLDAADVNDDGRVDLSDSIFLIGDLFLPVSDSIPPPGPFTCGPDGVTDGLRCDSSPACL